jgi:hypothetical protein
MTTTAKSNAVFRIGIVLHIVDVMNFFTALLADCTGVLVAFSNHALELVVECGRVWLERFSPKPGVMFSSNLVKNSALCRTKFFLVSIDVRGLAFKCLAAISTSASNAFAASGIMASCRAKNSGLVVWIDKKLFPTIRAVINLLASFPQVRLFTAVDDFRSAGKGAVFCLVGLATPDHKLFPAVLTNFSERTTFPVRSVGSCSTGRATGKRTEPGTVFSVWVNKVSLSTMLTGFRDIFHNNFFKFNALRKWRL